MEINATTKAETSLALRGEKVFLRPFVALDVDATYVGWLNDPDVVRFSNQRFLKHDKESCMRYFASFDGSTNLFVSARSLSDERQIGTLTAYVSRHHGTVDVGIMIGDKSIWGKGYGQDAWNLLTNWLLERKYIRKLTGGSLACNQAMIRIMESSGMKLEAVRKAQEVLEGQPMDIMYFAKFHDS